MKRRSWLIAAGIVSSALASGVTTAPLPAGAAEITWSQVANWNMDEPTAGTGCTSPATMVDASGHWAGPANGMVMPNVVLGGTGSSCLSPARDSGKFTFPGWRLVAPDPFRDLTLPRDAEVRRGQSQVVVPNATKLIPGLKSFKYVIRFKPANVWRTLDSDLPGTPARWLLPRVSGDATYNMFQKGHSGGGGGQVKIELVGNERVEEIDVNGSIVKRQVLGLVRCRFEDTAGLVGFVHSLIPANYGNFASKIECGIDRTAGTAFLTTFEGPDGVLPAPLTNTVALPRGFGAITTTEAVSIGRKPADDDALDTYAGDIRFLRYYASA